ncbi:RNA degradosome polyphosphate kinase [Roseiterribacter gracilis]|uniref:Polyphosphate kinase n=1 Tax=Roseiterribacter gracilis TaxID=2812848 RepID=A0A8S8XCD9_9PROT|nr:polyphosphate kinase [Rhodospirillales bacterium TMPK1]
MAADSLGIEPAIAPEDRLINRELSWLAFDQRVSEEAQNPNHPLFERIRFLSIAASNLDEFYMVRVAGLKQQIAAGYTAPSEGMTPAQQLAAVHRQVQLLMRNVRRTWMGMREELRAAGIAVLDAEELTDDERRWLSRKFVHEIFPILTPIAVGPTHPFPFIPNKGLGLAVELFDETGQRDLDAIVLMPSQLDRFIRLPSRAEKDNAVRFIPIEQVVLQHVPALFPKFRLKSSGVFRILRDSDLEVADLDIDIDAEHLLKNFETALKRRRRGNVVRLAASSDMSSDLLTFLRDQLAVPEEDVGVFESLIGITDVKQLIIDERPDLLFTPYVARFPERIRDFGGDCFAAIQAKDFVVHHPYESFDVVVQFLRQAARDPDVVAIKQTLYRTSRDSSIVQALIEAAEAGKSVTACVELKARFDEEANMRWARDLERSGAQVTFGFTDLKTHAKVSLVVRRESGQLRSYVHYGTGNYHPYTAKVYTDLSFFTCDPELTRDATRMFNYMTGYAKPDGLEKVSISPGGIRAKLEEQIRNEIAHAKAGRPAAIWAKMNSLVDEQIIELLYEASAAGVQIDLVIRGMCCLRAGVPGLSENIRVRSLIGRFLEHARIAAFGDGHALPHAKAKLFIGSADWAPRNLDRRIETLVPIENPTVHQQILDQILVANLKDDTQTWQLTPDNQWVRNTPGPKPFSAHEFFMTNPSLSGRGSASGDKKQKPKLKR